MLKQLYFKSKREVDRLNKFLNSGIMRYEVLGMEILKDGRFKMKIEVPEKNENDLMSLYSLINDRSK